MATTRRKDNTNRVLKTGEYQQKDGTYRFSWYDKTGKRHYRYAKTLEKLREIEKDILRDSLDGIQENSLTINDVYERWKSIKRGLRTNTFRNYTYMYDAFVRDKLGRMKITSVKKSDVRAFYIHLKEQLNIKVNTIDTIHTVLHQVFEVAVEDEYIRYNPSDRALAELRRTYTDDYRVVRALTHQEQDLFEDFLKRRRKDSHWRAVFITMLYTGMRVGELAALRWCDIDFENNLIDVNHDVVYYKRNDVAGCGYEIHKPKTKAGCRKIPMLPIVREVLLDEKEKNEFLEVDQSYTLDGYSGFVFINREGKIYNQHDLNRALDRIQRDCNLEQIDKYHDKAVLLPSFTNHWLRHTMATRMVEAGLSPKTIQAILGHSDITTTMNIYAEITDEFKAQQMASFNEFYNGFGTVGA